RSEEAERARVRLLVKRMVEWVIEPGVVSGGQWRLQREWLRIWLHSEGPPEQLMGARNAFRILEDSSVDEILQAPLKPVVELLLAEADDPEFEPYTIAEIVEAAVGIFSLIFSRQHYSAMKGCAARFLK